VTTLVRLSAHWSIVAFLSGFAGSLLTTRLIEEIAWGHRWHATGLEVLVVLTAIVGWQLWAARENDWKVLVVEGVGAVLGTNIVLS